MMTHGIFVGLSTVDLIYTLEEFPSPNAQVVARNQEVLAGGPATNAAIAFSHLGGSATLFAAVGSHALASLVRTELQRYSVDLIDPAPKSDQPPPISSVYVDGRGQRTVVSVNTTRSQIPAPQVDPSSLRNAGILLIDGHAMEACVAWAKEAQTHGIPVVLDAGSWKPGTERLLKNVDTAICSADFRPPGCTDEDSVIEYLQSLGTKYIAITRGPDPVRFVSDSSAGFIDVPHVEVVDTMGAGDIFHGAFCYYTAIGYNFVAALRQAATIAAESCRFSGTRAWMQSVPRPSAL